jgi:anti-sigma-K factor RskA
MSGAAPRNSGEDDGVDVLAGEYVLGLLDAEAARAVELRARTNTDLAAAIARWQSQFDPLSDVPAPVAPSDALWRRIETGIRPAPQMAPNAMPAPVVMQARPRPGAWRATALASMALAAGLAAFIVWSGRVAPAPAPWPRAVALLSAPGSASAALRAQITGEGTITVVPLQHLGVAADQRLGFWAWPASEKAPVLLGMMPAQGGQMRFPYPPREGTPIMVTLEKAGTAPITKPGPTLYLGLLVANRA